MMEMIVSCSPNLRASSNFKKINLEIFLPDNSISKAATNDYIDRHIFILNYVYRMLSWVGESRRAVAIDFFLFSQLIVCSIKYLRCHFGVWENVINCVKCGEFYTIFL